MKKILFLISMSCCLLLQAQRNTSLGTAQELLSLLQQAKGEKAYTFLDSYMQANLKGPQLSALFTTLEQQLGTFKSAKEWNVTSSGKLTKVTARLSFETIDLQYIVSFSEKKKINGLWFKPMAKEAPKEKKENALFKERKISISTGKYKLPGRITLPKIKNKVPCVILVQGSGPQDMDETLFKNKPMRDIAHGLAAQGIASIRYDKRTYCYASELASNTQITTQEEVVEDAISAFRFAQSQLAVDSTRIFVIGHSLGGMLAPRLLQQCKSFRGGILMAGIATSLADLILYQMKYLNKLNKGALQNKIKQLDKQIVNLKKINSPLFNKNIPLPINLPYTYWKDLESYHPTEVAQKLQQPFLILNGELDYQVPMTEFQTWKKELTSKKNVKFISYPTLTHLFMKGKNPPSPKDYLQKSQVSPQVIQDIATWIKQH